MFILTTEIRLLKVRPFTQAYLEHRKGEEKFDNRGPGIENTRVRPVHLEPPKLKRVAISAEPLSSMVGANDDILVKTPKSSL